MTEQTEITTTPPAEGEITSVQSAVLLMSIMVVALCGIAYELIISTVSSYLLGNSVYQFSLTIGLFMFAMGVGSYLSKLMGDQLIRNFIVVEIVIALVGGICSLSLFMAFANLNALYTGVQYLFIFAIGAMVGLEIPFLTTILSRRASLRDSIAHVMSLDYVGALIGSVAFPLLLLPQLGLIRSSFAIGLVNILTAIVSLLFFRKHIKGSGILLFFSVLIAVALIAFTIWGTRLTAWAERHLYFDQVIYTEQTPYQRIVITESTRHPDSRLYIDGHIQFSSRDEYRYHEALVHPVMSLPGKREKVLVLGGGDGLAAREILKYEDVQTIHLVDIDPAITEFAKNYPQLVALNNDSLSSPKLKVFNADAFTYINQPGMMYDRVIIDMPDPHNEVLNKLYSKEFYTMIKRRMAPEAKLVSQSTSPFFTREAYWCIEETLNFVFGHTDSYHTMVPAFGVWGFHLAAGAPLQTEQLSFDVPTRYLTNESMQAATVFPRDIEKLATGVNTIMEPTLYQFYLKGLKQ